MTRLGGWSQPGIGALDSTTHREIVWGGADWAHLVIKMGAWISGAARDAGNTDTTVLRDGLLLGKITASGKQIQWDATATDGSASISSILNNEIKAQDFNATNADRFLGTIVRAPLQASQLLIKGAAFVGHADEYLARRQLVDAGFILDDDPMGQKAGRGERVSYEAATTDVLTADQNGMTLFYSNAASVTVTLPAIKAGLEFKLVRVADEEFIVVSPTADNVIVGNDLSADGVTFTTAGEQIGATVSVRSVYVNGTLKWLMVLDSVPFGTGTATMAYSIQTA